MKNVKVMSLVLSLSLVLSSFAHTNSDIDDLVRASDSSNSEKIEQLRTQIGINLGKLADLDQKLEAAKLNCSDDKAKTVTGVAITASLLAAGLVMTKSGNTTVSILGSVVAAGGILSTAATATLLVLPCFEVIQLQSDVQHVVNETRAASNRLSEIRQ